MCHTLPLSIMVLLAADPEAKRLALLAVSLNNMTAWGGFYNYAKSRGVPEVDYAKPWARLDLAEALEYDISE